MAKLGARGRTAVAEVSWKEEYPNSTITLSYRLMSDGSVLKKRAVKYHPETGISGTFSGGWKVALKPGSLFDVDAFRAKFKRSATIED